MPNLYCDNYTFCNGYCVDMGDPHSTETRARAKGWHLYDGATQGGSSHRAALCPKCSGSGRRPALSSSEPLHDQEALF